MGEAHSEAARMQTGLSRRLAIAASSGAERVPGAIQAVGDAAGSATGALATELVPWLQEPCVFPDERPLLSQQGWVMFGITWVIYKTGPVLALAVK